MNLVILFQMVIINNLSFIHEISLEADGFLIFLNLEDEKTEDKLSYLIRNFFFEITHFGIIPVYSII